VRREPSDSDHQRENFKVRRSEKEDIPVLVDFTVKEAFESEGLQTNVSTVHQGVKAAFEGDSIAAYWVLENLDSARIVGSVSIVEEWSDWNAAPYWFIQGVYILPEFRGKKLMNLMLDEVKKEARERKVVELRLYVHKNNSRAIKAFLQDGFEFMPYQLMSQRPAAEKRDTETRQRRVP